MGKSGFLTQEEAEAVAQAANRPARSAKPGMLSEQEVYKYRDPVTHARKWFIRAEKGQPQATHKVLFRKKLRSPGVQSLGPPASPSGLALCGRAGRKDLAVQAARWGLRPAWPNRLPAVRAAR